MCFKKSKKFNREVVDAWDCWLEFTVSFLVLAVAAVVMVLGFFWLRNVSVDVLPEFAPPFVEIQTEALGLPVAE